MTAEPIAKVMLDLQGKGKTVGMPKTVKYGLHRSALARIAGPVVDATMIYHDLVKHEEEIDLYGDHPCITPPWKKACICYVNEHGNVVVMALYVKERHNDPEPEWRQANQNELRGGKPGAVLLSPQVEWAKVRWVVDTCIWVGGEGNVPHTVRDENGKPKLDDNGEPMVEYVHQKVPTTGPFHMFNFAIDEQGAPLDIHWYDFTNGVYGPEHWDMALMVLLTSLNYLNCKNVEIAEPSRPRAERRRMERTGSPSIYTINVFPPGQSSTKSAKGAPVGGMPLSPVRGHFAHYGPQFGKGLLFGKYSGRYWIGQHVRGSAELGENEVDYKLVTARG